MAKKSFRPITAALTGAGITFVGGIITMLVLSECGVIQLVESKSRTYFIEFYNDGALMYSNYYIRGQEIEFAKEAKPTRSPDIDGQLYIFVGWDITGDGLVDVCPTNAYFSFRADAVYKKVDVDDFNENVDYSDLYEIMDQGQIDQEPFINSTGLSEEGLSDLFNKPVLTYKSDYNGLIYFRTESFGNFSGERSIWLESDYYSRKNISENSVNPLEYAADKIQTAISNETPKLNSTYSISIDYKMKGEKYPVPAYEIGNKEDLNSDSYSLTNPSNKHYTTTATYAYANNKNISLAAKASFSSSAIRKDELNYRDYAYEHYTEVDPSRKNSLLNLASNLGVTSHVKGKMDYGNVDLIHNYFVENYRFSMTTDTIPSNVDSLDYFIFESHIGNGRQFASATTLMFRALGYPARYVQGYVDYNSNPGVKKDLPVSQSNAWTEVYVDGLGWVIQDTAIEALAGGSSEDFYNQEESDFDNDISEGYGNQKVEEPGDDPGEDPGEDPGKDPGEDPGEQPGGEDPGENPGGEDPGEDPGENPGGEDPGEDPGEQPGGEDPGENPGENPGGEEPGENPGENPGGEEPGGEEPGGEDPGENPGGEEPGGEEPGENPGGEEPGGEEPGENPGGEEPGGEEPGGEDPGENPGGEEPGGEEPGGEDPGENPGGEEPGENPGEQPGGEEPGGEEPGENPGGEGGGSGSGIGVSGGVSNEGPGSDSVDDAQNQEILKFTSNHSGTCYFRALSYKDFNATRSSWSNAHELTESEVQEHELTMSPLLYTHYAADGLFDDEWYEVDYSTGMQYGATIQFSSEDFNNGLISDFHSAGSVKSNDSRRMEAPQISASAENISKLRTNLATKHPEIASEVNRYSSYAYSEYTNVDSKYVEYFTNLAETSNITRDDPNVILKIANLIRSSATYNIDFEAYPAGVDPILYFMQEAREGICNNFASAAVMMYRSLGIPARFTGGYAGSSTVGEENSVTGDRAHAWTEVYVDGVGWMMVDATASGGRNPASGGGGSGGGSGPIFGDWSELGGDITSGGGGGGGSSSQESSGRKLEITIKSGRNIVGLDSKGVLFGEKTYDGFGFDLTAEANTSTSMNAGLYPGDKIVLTYDRCQDWIQAGSYSALVKLKIVNSDGKDVTKTYQNLTIVGPGGASNSLGISSGEQTFRFDAKVKPRTLFINTGTQTWTYNRNDTSPKYNHELTWNNAEYLGGTVPVADSGLLATDTIDVESVVFLNTISSIGQVDNSIDVSTVRIYDSNELDVTSSYELVYTPGTLTMKR